MTALHRMPALILLLLSAAAPPQAGPLLSASAPVTLSAQPRTPTDAAARKLVAQDLAEANRAGETPLLLIGTATLGRATDPPALFVQIQSPRECGSAGCSTAVFASMHGVYARVLDGVSGRISVAPTRHQGMADLATDTDRYVWDGRAYRTTHPAPPINLRRLPASRPAHRAPAPTSAPAHTASAPPA